MVETLANPPIFDALMRFKPPHWTPNKWAVEAGVSRSVWSDIRSHGNPTRNVLEKLLTAAGSSLAEFEALRTDVPVRTEVRGSGIGVGDVESAWRAPEPSRPVPLLGSAMGGSLADFEDAIELTELHLGEVLDYLARPPSLTGDKAAYAVTIVGDSMAPRFEPGERAFVSPRTPVSIGDDVIVQLRAAPAVGDDGAGSADPASQISDRVTMVLIKRLVRQSAKSVELRQFNPEMTFTVPVERIAAIHRVRGRL